MVANSIQNLPAFVDSGQHSIVTAPADTGPSPRMRNLTLRGSGSTSFLPAPVVALSCNRLRTLIIVCALLHWDIEPVFPYKEQPINYAEWPKPSQVVALTWSAVATFSMLIVFSLSQSFHPLF
jgi:hypothetical protein